MYIEIWSKTNCPYCDMAERIAQQFVQESDNNYVKWMLDEDFTREELFEKFPGARTFPQIRVDGENIGGYTEFKELIENMVD
tara:strand:+ start:4035 stop:4280 length:246 start_codon:yes stop_codon:yes gene_type:complete